LRFSGHRTKKTSTIYAFSGKNAQVLMGSNSTAPAL
jgi:hypothetical protein